MMSLRGCAIPVAEVIFSTSETMLSFSNSVELGFYDRQPLSFCGKSSHIKLLFYGMYKYYF